MNNTAITSQQLTDSSLVMEKQCFLCNQDKPLTLKG